MITMPIEREPLDPAKTTDAATSAASSPLTVAREAHVEEYLIENPAYHRSAIGARDAIEHGWSGATAEIADRIDTLVAEARHRVIVQRLPFDILAHLETLSDELKREIGI